jgi:hypothetical protein
MAEDSLSYINGRIVMLVGEQKEGVFDARVDLLKYGIELKAGVRTDGEGYFRMGPVEAGIYTLRIQSSEIPGPKVIPNIPLAGGKTLATGDILMSSTMIVCPSPPVKRTKETGKTILTKEDIIRMPYSIQPVQQLRILPLRNSCLGRCCPNVYYIDGIRMKGPPSIPGTYIKMKPMLKGIPAEYEGGNETVESNCFRSRDNSNRLR